MDTEEIGKLLLDYGKIVDERLQEFLPKHGDLVKYLSEPIVYHMGTGGKRARPALCLLTCEMLGGKKEDALPFAIATEFFHNFTLLHDDVEDEDKMRRDQATVAVKYGVPNAINCGDYLFMLSMKAVTDTKLPPQTVNRLMNVLVLTALRTGEGQALDLNYRADKEFSLEKYLELVQLKTGYYFVFGMVGGAICAGADDATVEKIWKLGKNVGAAFQIRDDIIDLTEGKGRGGEIGCDIKEGKPSILFAYALQKATAEEKKKLAKIMQKAREKTTDDDVKWTIELYNRYGLIEQAQKKADELILDAEKIVSTFTSDKQQLFKDIVQFMAKRRK